MVLTSVKYYDTRSEWDIYDGNLGINPKDRLLGLGAEAFSPLTASGYY